MIKVFRIADFGKIINQMDQALFNVLMDNLRYFIKNYEQYTGEFKSGIIHGKGKISDDWGEIQFYNFLNSKLYS